MENAIQKAQAGALAKNPQKKNLTDLIKIMAPEIKKALPSMITPERFTRMVTSAISKNPKLTECTSNSFLAAMMASAQMGMEPNTNLQECFLIPYRNKGVMEVQFQLGYRGMINLAYRSGQVSSIQAHAVYEHDKFEYELGLEPKLVHVPADRDRGEATHYYAVVKMKDGGFCFAVLSKDDVMKHAKKYSKSFSDAYSPWTTSFDEMAKKTVLKKALKYAPMSTEFTHSMSQDETIKTELSDEMYTVVDSTDYTIVDEVPAVDPDTGEVV